MCTHVQTRTSQRLFFLGIALFVLANTTIFLAQRAHIAGENRIDALTGMFYGAAFGVLLLALIRRNRAS